MFNWITRTYWLGKSPVFLKAIFPEKSICGYSGHIQAPQAQESSNHLTVACKPRVSLRWCQLGVNGREAKSSWWVWKWKYLSNLADIQETRSLIRVKTGVTKGLEANPHVSQRCVWWRRESQNLIFGMPLNSLDPTEWGIREDPMAWFSLMFLLLKDHKLWTIW